ncbi:protein FAM32A isoform X2 [Vidua macroura]|uniref:protein FAM32A isoform X2 n=1 Tax=Vidua macroura TaxID=187451 RepID=UPI0023A7AE2C|nr:protein FAM32A isoform X2 [Vidua macroura]
MCKAAHGCPGSPHGGAGRGSFSLSLTEVQGASVPLTEGLVPSRRKKKKAKDKAQILEQIVSSKKQEEEKKRGLDKRTPAQVAYEKMQEKRQMERILKKASKTHKQRVEDFNRHLDTLTEHYDIPKVSWTK